MTRVAIFDVTTDVRTRDLHAYDRDIVGVYGVIMGDGIAEHPMEPRDLRPDPEDDPLEEAAKDVFHDHVGIKRLDDFSIPCEILPEGAPVPEDWKGRHIQWL